MQNPNPPDLSRFTVVALLYLGSAAAALFMCTPAFVVLMVQDWKFSEAATGGVIGAAVAGNTVGALLAGIRSTSLNRRPILTGAAVLAVLGYGLAGLGGSPTLIGAELALAGLGGGALIAEALRTLTYSRYPHRYLSWNTLVQNLSAALLLGIVLPGVGEDWGTRGGFALLTALAAPCLFLAGAFPGQSREDVHAGSGRFNPWGVTALLVSTFVYYILIGVVWTFVGTLGLAHDLRSEDVDRVAGFSNLISLAVCLLAPRLERSDRTRGWSILSVAVTLAGVWAMAFSSDLMLFAVSFAVMTAAWTLYSIVVQSLFPSVDPTGRYAGFTAGLLGLGYFVGSFVGGHYIERFGAVNVFAAAACLGALAGAVLLLVPRVYAARRTDESDSMGSGSKTAA